MPSSSSIKPFHSIHRFQIASSSLKQNSIAPLNKIGSTNKRDNNKRERPFYDRFLQTKDMTGRSTIEKNEKDNRQRRRRRRGCALWPCCSNCCCALSILALALLLCGLAALLVALFNYKRTTTTTTTTTTSEFHYYFRHENSRHSYIFQ